MLERTLIKLSILSAAVLIWSNFLFAQTGEVTISFTATSSVIEKLDSVDSIAVVHFWALWCEPCKEELPALLSRTKEFSNIDFSIVSIDSEKWKKPAKSYLIETILDSLQLQNNVTFVHDPPTKKDGVGELMKRYAPKEIGSGDAVKVLPRTLIIFRDDKGMPKIIDLIGKIDWLNYDIIEAIKK